MPPAPKAQQPDLPGAVPPPPKIKWLDVTDSEINRIGHDGAAMVLAIEFKGKGGRPDTIYHYRGVDQGLFMDLATADNVYQVFYRRIRNDSQTYPYKKIE